MPALTVQPRAVARTASVNDLVTGTYVATTDTTPSYLETPRGRISRASLIAVIVSKPSQNAVILDDGTGRIEARAFNDAALFEHRTIGEVVLLVGKPRAYQNAIYVVAEIAKKLSPGWLEYRKAELAATAVQDGAVVERNDDRPGTPRSTKITSLETTTAMKTKTTAPTTEMRKSTMTGTMTEKNTTKMTKPTTMKPTVNVPKPAAAEENVVSRTDRILQIIRDLDDGQGASVDDVLIESGGAKAETILTNLLADGEIFEIKPGRVKVLE